MQPCRGTGASIELVNTFERIVISRGYESYGLSVHNDNYRAIKFYNKMGMTIENRDKKSIYYIIKTKARIVTINAIRNIVVSNKNLINNFISLSLFNIFNLLLPLITIPYLVRVVGTENYGLYSFVYAIIQYIVLFSAFGFNLSATKWISIYRDNKDKLNLFYSSVTLARIFIGITGVAFVIFLSLFLNVLYENLNIILMGCGIILGDALTPIWLFQGMEKMKYLTIVNFISKTIFTIAIFFLINSSDDYAYIILLNSIGYLAAGFCSVILVYKYFKLKFCIPRFTDIVYVLKDGLSIFISTLGINFYRNSNIVLLGFFSTDYIVGVYSVAEKVIKAFQSLTTPITDSLYPFLCKRFSASKFNNNILLLKKVSYYIIPVFFLISTAIFLFAPIIVKILFGNSNMDSIMLLKIMSPIVIFGGMGYLFGVLGLYGLGYDKLFLRNVVISGCLSIICLIAMVHITPIISGGVAMLISEFALFAACLLSIMKLSSQVHDENQTF